MLLAPLIDAQLNFFFSKWLESRYRPRMQSTWSAGNLHVTDDVMLIRSGEWREVRRMAGSSTDSAFFSVGKRFNSFADLQERLSVYESSTYTELWRRDSRSVEAARKRINRPFSDAIIYYEMTYSCIHGGKKFAARGEGKRSTSYVQLVR